MNTVLDEVTSDAIDAMHIRRRVDDREARLNGLFILRPFKVLPGVCPAQRVRHLPGALRRTGRVRLVAVAEQRAAVLTEKLVHMTARAYTERALMPMRPRAGPPKLRASNPPAALLDALDPATARVSGPPTAAPTRPPRPATPHLWCR